MRNSSTEVLGEFISALWHKSDIKSKLEFMKTKIPNITVDIREESACGLSCKHNGGIWPHRDTHYYCAFVITDEGLQQVENWFYDSDLMVIAPFPTDLAIPKGEVVNVVECWSYDDSDVWACKM